MCVCVCLCVCVCGGGGDNWEYAMATEYKSITPVQFSTSDY